MFPLFLLTIQEWLAAVKMADKWGYIPHSAPSTHACGKFAHTQREERCIWSVREYLSSTGNCFDNSKIVIAALNAF